jgi:hypothetical protein
VFVLKFWPRGDDAFSRATRVKTTMIFLWCALWLIAGAGIVSHIRRFCGC